jgi:hypothetical protein
MVAAWAISWVDSSPRMKVTVPGIATVDPVVASAPGYTGRWSWLYWYSMLNELMSVIKFVGKESLLPLSIQDLSVKCQKPKNNKNRRPA